MRLDLFLKYSQLIKRRSKANQYCNEGNVLVNNSPGKPSKKVKVHDEIEITFPTKLILLKVISIPQKGTPKSEMKNCYEILKETEIGLWD